MNSPERNRAIMSFEMFLYGADSPESICDSTYATGPLKEEHCSGYRPLPNSKGKVLSTIIIDSKTGEAIFGDPQKST